MTSSCLIKTGFHTAEELDELWALVIKPQSNVVIWCDGLAREADTITTATTTTRSRKRKKQVDVPEMVSKKHVDTHERIQTLVDQLKEKHNTKCT